jgi:hypothetical protein
MASFHIFIPMSNSSESEHPLALRVEKPTDDPTALCHHADHPSCTPYTGAACTHDAPPTTDLSTSTARSPPVLVSTPIYSQFVNHCYRALAATPYDVGRHLESLVHPHHHSLQQAPRVWWKNGTFLVGLPTLVFTVIGTVAAFFSTR